MSEEKPKASTPTIEYYAGAGAGASVGAGSSRAATSGEGRDLARSAVAASIARL